MNTLKILWSRHTTAMYRRPFFFNLNAGASTAMLISTAQRSAVAKWTRMRACALWAVLGGCRLLGFSGDRTPSPLLLSAAIVVPFLSERCHQVWEKRLSGRVWDGWDLITHIDYTTCYSIFTAELLSFLLCCAESKNSQWPVRCPDLLVFFMFLLFMLSQVNQARLC